MDEPITAASRRWLTRAPLAFAALVAALSTASCGAAATKIGGKTADEVFPPAVARLGIAACGGDADGIAKAVRAGADPNAEGFEGVTPLLWAVNCHDQAGVRALVAVGADINRTGSAGFNAIWAMAASDDSAMLKLLFDLGGRPEAASKSGELAFARAAEKGNAGDWTNYELFLAAGMDPNIIGERGNTVTLTLVALGEMQRIIDLIERHGYTHDLPKLRQYVNIRQIGRQFPAYQHKITLLALLDKRISDAQ